MLRTDYVSLDDAERLSLLDRYYVDYFNYLPQILGENDQLVVGRRGTGKTTLLYRGLIECMKSWDPKTQSSCYAKPRSLGIYIDLGKCQSLQDSGEEFKDLEHSFVTEMCESIEAQLMRFWPGLGHEPNLLDRVFRASESRKVSEVQQLLKQIGELLRTGIPRWEDRSGTVTVKDSVNTTISRKRDLGASIGTQEAGVNASHSGSVQEASSRETQSARAVTYRLTLVDVFRLLRDLKLAAGISAIHVFIDEYSVLSDALQGRFSTLLKRILGSQSGVYIKLCAITDNYTLGSSIILQRDLFEISLDLDTFVERSGSLNAAMKSLEEQCERIVRARLQAYECPSPEQLFDAPQDAWYNLSRSAMGVPRTLGIVLKEAWNRASVSPNRTIRKRDISYGISHASSAYQNHLMGAAKDGLGIPAYVADLWSALLERAQSERSKVPDVGASHFMVLPKNEHLLKYLSMFFLVHLLTKGRTTKKDRQARSLYCFDFGTCVENNLGLADDKNVLRQQRFAYDDVLVPFETKQGEMRFRCPTCNRVYRMEDLRLPTMVLTHCPFDKTDLIAEDSGDARRYTEEEIRILGAMRAAKREDQKIAREIADDVGCYVQKAAKFGEKLEREGLVVRAKEGNQDRYIYFGQGKTET